MASSHGGYAIVCQLCGGALTTPVESPCGHCGATPARRALAFLVARLPVLREVPRVRVLTDRPDDAVPAPDAWEVEIAAPGPRGDRPRVDVVLVDEGVAPLPDVADHVVYSGFVVGVDSEPAGCTATRREIGEVVLPGDVERLHLPPTTALWLGRPARGGVRNAHPPWWVTLLPGPGTPSSGSTSTPVVVVGAPRSGTTYLTRLLDQHPDAHVTSETRNLVAVTRLLHRSLRDTNQSHRHTDRFVDHLLRTLPAVVEDFYRGLRRHPLSVWGDKFPHYADAQTNPETLALVARLWPRVRVVALLRDPRRVVASIQRKGWVEAEEAVSVWSRHTLHAREFAAVHAPGCFHELRHEDLVSDGPGTWEPLRRFLGLDEEDRVSDFLAEQARDRTPYSTPTTAQQHLGDLDAASVPEPVEALVASRLPLQLVETGYARAEPSA